MYGITLDTTHLLMTLGQIPDSATLCLEDANPYMTQQITVYFTPQNGQIPVLSWQLAYQLDQHRKQHPGLRYFRFVPLSREEGWPVPRKLEDFDNVPPGARFISFGQSTARAWRYAAFITYSKSPGENTGTAWLAISNWCIFGKAV
ncbi:MAG: hypothetical protein Q9P14_02930 [candidate division KSB1 bacterium]|nr:hypothetical protein [candidate division KSB1 bacterium]